MVSARTCPLLLPPETIGRNVDGGLPREAFIQHTNLHPQLGSHYFSLLTEDHRQFYLFVHALIQPSAAAMASFT